MCGFLVFRARYGGPFNCTVPSRQVMEAVWRDPGCQGIPLNSAVSPHSITIDRAKIRTLLEA